MTTGARPGATNQEGRDALSDTSQSTATDDDTTTDSTDDSTLGDAGQRAIQAERAKRKDLERQLRELKPLADKARETEEASKTEVQRLTEQLATATKERDDAVLGKARLQVALDKGLTPTQAKRLVGTTEEELAEDADELLADLGAKPGGEQTDDTDDGAGGKPVGGQVVREDLRPGGGDPNTPVEETDLDKLGSRMFKNR